MNELFLYDRDEGLFKKILEKSKVMQGRYFIVSSGLDLNAVALEISEQKYPCVVCVTPRSTFLPPDFVKQAYSFSLFFLARHGVTGQNQIKDIDLNKLVSNHPSWYDWKDMNECAGSFIRMLLEVLRTKYVEGQPLKGLVLFDKASINVDRLTKKGNDLVSGVKLSFSMTLNFDCSPADYPDVDLADIELPDLNIHPIHKH